MQRLEFKARQLPSELEPPSGDEDCHEGGMQRRLAEGEEDREEAMVSLQEGES